MLPYLYWFLSLRCWKSRENKAQIDPGQRGYCFYFYNGTWFGDVLRGPGGDPGAVVEVGASGEFANIGDKHIGFWSANLSPF